jgi:hypothetical protein
MTNKTEPTFPRRSPFRPQRQFQPPPPEPPPPAESHQSPYVHNPSLAIWLLWIVALLALCVGVVGFFLGMGDYQHAGRGTAGEMAMLEAKWSMLSSLYLTGGSIVLMVLALAADAVAEIRNIARRFDRGR